MRTNDEHLFERLADLYKPYKSEHLRLRELEAQVKELTLRFNKLNEFCKLQAEINSDLVKILKTTMK